MSEDRLYTISETAKLLGISTQTLRRWDKSGKFLSKRHPINNYRVYSGKQVLNFIKELDSNKSQKSSRSLKKFDKFLSTKSGSLYNIDAVDFLKSIPDNSVELVFADPPYNIKKAQWDTFESQKKYIDWSMEWIREAKRILTDNGSLYICGFSEILADLKWAAAPLFKGCKWLIWFYRNKANLGKDWGRSHESLLHLRKSRDFIFNIDEVRIPYNEHTVKYPNRSQGASSQYSNGKKYEWSPNPLGAKPKDVLEIPTISNRAWERFNHPTQKPVDLLRKVVLSSSNPGNTVVDPFGGSGTTYAVSEAYGRNWLGSELEVDYCKEISKRLLDSDHIERIYRASDESESKKRREKLRGKEDVN